MWKPILETVTRSLKEKGALILSHVPRAALPAEFAEQKKCSIEDIILVQARDYGLLLTMKIGPRDLPSILQEESSDMEEAGAAIFILEKHTS
mmetsp:Transcript_3279/g.5661  ORF Transcript_3279/g.5661 Transcript_3279/m.5661 type:complete len:92 (-) Transcript_3279:34-309(-)